MLPCMRTRIPPCNPRCTHPRMQCLCHRTLHLPCASHLRKSQCSPHQCNSIHTLFCKTYIHHRASCYRRHILRAQRKVFHSRTPEGTVYHTSLLDRNQTHPSMYCYPHNLFQSPRDNLTHYSQIHPTPGSMCIPQYFLGIGHALSMCQTCHTFLCNRLKSCLAGKADSHVDSPPAPERCSRCLQSLGSTHTRRCCHGTGRARYSSRTCRTAFHSHMKNFSAHRADSLDRGHMAVRRKKSRSSPSSRHIPPYFLGIAHDQSMCRTCRIL